MKPTLIKLWKKFIFHFPSPLPRGMKALEEFTDEILDTYDLPNNESMHFAMANMIMRTDKSHLPKRAFARAMMNQMAKEVAFHREADLRRARKEREEKEKLEAAKAAEVPVEVQDTTVQSA